MTPMPQTRNRRPRTIILAVACAMVACASGPNYSDGTTPGLMAEQEATDIVIISDSKGCFVEPAHALVDQDQQIRYVNATGNRVRLMFPTGEALFADSTQIFDLEAGRDSLTANVVADVGTQHDYAPFCFEINTFAEGRSHPTVIIK